MSLRRALLVGCIAMMMMGSLIPRASRASAFRQSMILPTRRQQHRTARISWPQCISTISKNDSRIHRSIRHPSVRSASYVSRASSSTHLFQSTQRFHDLSAAEYSSLADDGTYVKPVVQWYPGHIAKAERQLSETLKAVDVVVEVRDARACKATSHPRVGEWCAGRPRIVVLTHLDTVPKTAINSWKRAYELLGAERWDDAPINRQVANQAQQARDFRNQYGDGPNAAAQSTANNNNKKKSNKISSSYNKNNNSSSKGSSNAAITPVEEVLFVNAKQGQGIHALHRAIFKAGAHVQERRERRGLNPRALRVGIIGYPNVGKSALINKILGRKRARTANTPGVTRSLQWIRVRADESKVNSSGSAPSSSSSKKEFELLDSPGIIPAKMVDQSDALLLAACNCIGEAAYDNQAVAAYLCEWIKAIHIIGKEYLSAPDWRANCKERYGFDPMKKIEIPQADIEADPIYDYMTGEDMLFQVADNTCQGDPEDASRKIIQDFRAGRMGPISLQLAPETEEDAGQLQVPIGDFTILGRQSRDTVDEDLVRQIQEERARAALETAKERGLELPPVIQDPDRAKDSGDIGKGMFDGW